MVVSPETTRSRRAQRVAELNARLATTGIPAFENVRECLRLQLQLQQLDREPEDPTPQDVREFLDLTADAQPPSEWKLIL